MLFWTHLVVGLFGVLLLIGHFHNWLGFLLMGIIGSVLLDIDSPNSRWGKKGISKVLTAFTTHRGFIHSLLFVFGFSILLWIIFGNIAIGFLVGALIHLLLDCFTLRGVRLFYPFKFRVRGIVRSGGFFEVILFIVFFILDVFLVMAFLVV